MSPKDLAERIAKAQAQGAGDGSGPGSDDNGALGGALGFGLSAGAQFVGAVVGGGGLGWVLDRWLGTSPFCLLVLMILFFGAALVNVWRTMSRAVDAATAAAIASEKSAAEIQAERDTDKVDGEPS